MRPIPDEQGTMLLVGGEGHKPGDGSDTNEPYEKLAAFAREHFGLNDIAYRWAAHDYVSVDHVPYVGPLTRFTENVLVGTGFAKWGFSNGAAAAIMLTDRIMGRSNPLSGFFDSKRIDPLQSATGFARENGEVAFRFVTDRLPLGHRAGVEDLEIGEGGVFRSGIDKVAVVRDEAGIRRYSATCTHLGCVVGWNSAEKTFDCPCHGSRFDSRGRVIHGPAVRDLREIG